MQIPGHPELHNENEEKEEREGEGYMVPCPWNKKPRSGGDVKPSSHFLNKSMFFLSLLQALK